MSTLRNLFLGVGAGLSLAASLLAQPVVSFDTDGVAGTVDELEPAWVSTGVTASAVIRGGGLAAASLSNGFASTGFNSGVNNSLADAIASGDFLEFTVAPTAGYTLSLTSLDLNLRRTSTGPSSFEWRYSFDSFVTGGTQFATFTYTGTETNGAAQVPVDLSAIDDLQDITFGETLTFRLYGAGATSAAGSLTIGRLTGTDLNVSGSLSPVPEPETYAFWAGGAVFGFVAWQRRRRRRLNADLGGPAASS